MPTTDNARNQAITQMQYIEKLLSAYRMDWEFLEDLKDHCEDEDLDTLNELIEQAAGCSDSDEALELLEENPLSVRYRSDWESDPADLVPTEFEILLCTGGPAVRIHGEIGSYGTPSRAWVEYQDWGTPWTELPTYQGTALEYAQLLIQVYYP